MCGSEGTSTHGAAVRGVRQLCDPPPECTEPFREELARLWLEIEFFSPRSVRGERRVWQSRRRQRGVSRDQDQQTRPGIPQIDRGLHLRTGDTDRRSAHGARPHRQAAPSARHGLPGRRHRRCVRAGGDTGEGTGRTPHSVPPRRRLCRGISAQPHRRRRSARTACAGVGVGHRLPARPGASVSGGDR